MRKAGLNRKAGVIVCAMAAAALLGSAAVAFADPAAGSSADAQTPLGIDQAWAVHGQITNIWQDHPNFTSPYQGTNSLPPKEHAAETTDATAYLGARLWAGAEFWVNPEINQGIAPGDTLGVAGYVNGDGAKVGKLHPYFRVQRGFIRQTINLGGETQKIDPDQNVLSGAQSADRVVITVGKFNTTDIFDGNTYAHDSKNDFLNWSMVDAGSFDYAADAWGYSYGAAAEWYAGAWTLRGGAMALSRVPNGKELTPMFGQFQMLAEVEHRQTWRGREGKIRLTVFDSRGRMGSFGDALALAAITHSAPDTGLVRKYSDRVGVSASFEQPLSNTLGVFARVGADQANVEPYEYADIDDTVQAGLSMSGDGWGRKDDTVAIAGVINAISKIHEAYLNAGGLGILVGDGKLPHPGPEQIIETYYSAAVIKDVRVTLDAQLIANPAYNRDRGPVAMLSLRLHGQF
jgi:high affinity Mn2+ porin